MIYVLITLLIGACLMCSARTISLAYAGLVRTRLFAVIVSVALLSPAGILILTWGSDMTIRFEELPYMAFLACMYFAFALYAAFHSPFMWYSACAFSSIGVLLAWTWKILW